MANLGNTVTILCRGNGSASANGVQLLRIPVEIPDKVLAGMPSQLAFSLRAAGYISRIVPPPDVTILNFRLSAMAISHLRIPKIYTVHVPEAFGFMKSASVAANPLNLPLYYIKRMAETDVMKHSDQLIVQNHWIKEYIETLGYDDARIAVVPNAVDLRDFPPQSDADDSYVLFVGRLDWNKRPEMVLEAFARLDKELQNRYTVRIIGTGYSARKVRERARALGISGRVQFLGFLPRSEVLRQISRCSVLVLPSLYESFPVVMLEGMACRKTVIASDIPGPQDAISSGKNGLLFKSSSLDQLVEMIRLALSDDAFRRQIGRSARGLVESQYTFVSTAREYLSVASSISADDL